MFVAFVIVAFIAVGIGINRIMDNQETIAKNQRKIWNDLQDIKTYLKTKG